MYFGLVVLLDSGLTTWARTTMSRQLLAHMQRTRTHAHAHVDDADGGSEGDMPGLTQPLLAAGTEGEGGQDTLAAVASPATGKDGDAAVPRPALPGGLGFGPELTRQAEGSEDPEEEEDVDVRAERMAVQRGASGHVCM